MPDYVRRLRLEDIPQVLEIDREAFPTEWPPPNLKHELDNHMAHYIVACRSSEMMEEAVKPEDPPDNGFNGLLSRLRILFGGNKPAALTGPAVQGGEVITGFAGFWIMVDEAHITSIASRGIYRGQGIGELLLQTVIDMAAERKARIATLEVRVSNSVAQNLYTKYGFNQVGLRRGYYSDNREDALIMSTDQINSTEFQKSFRELQKNYRIKWGAARHQLSH
ncbi:MAG TPA: ribosomal protein S18-alanine N-acetyltransferase [Dehalococcoidia bacterium]|nr:ribosomal protein S18-alanine N-acetyltransferase [Dehalococcoidia bacterium]